MEKWLTIDGYMNTFFGLVTAVASVGSLILVYLGFKLAENYLIQHREKIKEERRIHLIMDLKKDLYLLRGLAIKFYKKPRGCWYAYELEKDENFEKMKEFVMDISSKISNEEPLEIGLLRADITAKLELYGNSSLITLYSIFQKSFGFLNLRYLDLNYYLSQESLGSEFCIEKFMEIPGDFRMMKNQELKASGSAFLNLQKSLTEEYHKN